MKSSKVPLICILGPTSSGKTALAVKLSKKFNGEIISADSRQVYLGMDIGTGKEGTPSKVTIPTLGRQPIRLIDGIPQYLVDLLPPSQTFTAADFQKLAPPIIDYIIERNKVPFIVGGTGLYVSALTQGFKLPASSKSELRLRQKLEEKTTAELLSELKTKDPQTYEKIDQNNRRRIIRALAASLDTGQPFSQQMQKNPAPYDTLFLALDIPRPELYQKIDRRVDKRLKQGMIDEVQILLNQGIPPARLISFGLEYRFLTEFLTGKIKSQDDMVTRLKFASHAYARRQITWLKHQLPVIWIKDEKQAFDYVSKFLSSHPLHKA